MNVLLIFDIHDLNGALFLKISYSFSMLALLSRLTAISPFATIYASLKSHKSDLNKEVLNLMFSLNEF